jgi:hypothetical protein
MGKNIHNIGIESNQGTLDIGSYHHTDEYYIQPTKRLNKNL